MPRRSVPCDRYREIIGSNAVVRLRGEINVVSRRISKKRPPAVGSVACPLANINDTAPSTATSAAKPGAYPIGYNPYFQSTICQKQIWVAFRLHRITKPCGVGAVHLQAVIVPCGNKSKVGLAQGLVAENRKKVRVLKQIAVKHLGDGRHP